MAKTRTFGDKLRKSRGTGKRMARIIAAEKKPNGQIRFRVKVVPDDEVQRALSEAKKAL